MTRVMTKATIKGFTAILLLMGSINLHSQSVKQIDTYSGAISNFNVNQTYDLFHKPIPMKMHWLFTDDLVTMTVTESYDTIKYPVAMYIVKDIYLISGDRPGEFWTVYELAITESRDKTWFILLNQYTTTTIIRLENPKVTIRQYWGTDVTPTVTVKYY